MDRILPLRDFFEYFQINEYDELLINNQQLPPDKTEFICSSGRFPDQSQSIDLFPLDRAPATFRGSWAATTVFFLPPLQCKFDE